MSLPAITLDLKTVGNIHSTLHVPRYQPGYRCERYGAEPPTFEERDRVVYMTFRAQILPGVDVGGVTPQVTEILKTAVSPYSCTELQQAAGIKYRELFRKAYLEPAPSGIGVAGDDDPGEAAELAPAISTRSLAAQPWRRNERS